MSCELLSLELFICNYYIAALLHVTLLHCYIAILLYCYIVILFAKRVLAIEQYNNITILFSTI